MSETRPDDVQRPAPASDPFGDLTVAELIDEIVRRPALTLGVLFEYLSQPLNRPPSAPLPEAAPLDEVPTPRISPRPMAPLPQRAAAALAPVERLDWVMFALRLVGLTLAWIGTASMAFSLVRTEAETLLPGLVLSGVGLVLWMVAAGIAERSTPSRRWNAPPAAVLDWRLTDRLEVRVVIAAIGTLGALIAFSFSAGNLFRIPGVLGWIVAVVAWVWALAPQGWTPFYPLQRWRERLQNHTAASLGSGLRLPWVALALIAIVALGAAFRLTDLFNTPPEMTSDHVEKLLDSQRVFDGQYQIYFQNNGGREPLQMYVMAAFVGLTGQPMNHDTLKLLTALEGIITLPIFFWLGRELVGRHDRHLGLIVGLALAALVAASYWHTTLSRLALRIVYTPAIVALIFLYFSRALRDNRRIDWINTGLALGAGLYMYQVVRIMPALILVGAGMALVFFARTWADRRRYVVNLLTLIIVSLMVFIPLLRFSYDYPEDFWRRTSGRLFGDDLTQVVNEDGTITERLPTIEERITAFTDNLPQLTENLRNAALMYTWKGDVAWITASPNTPAFDPLTGALLMVGLGGWLGWIFFKRDPALWLVLPAWFILLLPSALSIAYPIENPSTTRMSGTLPFVYLLAAFGMGVLIHSFFRFAAGRSVLILAGLTFTTMTLISYAANSVTYFQDFRVSYLISSKPYSDAGERLRMFAVQEGGYGNAFMVGYPFWWDHRAIGIEGGRIDWPNGIVSGDLIPGFLLEAARRGDDYRLDVDQPLLFMLAPEDEATLADLEMWFPEGRADLLETSQPEDTYRVYEVPALGAERFAEFIGEFGPPEANEPVG